MDAKCVCNKPIVFSGPPTGYSKRILSFKKISRKAWSESVSRHDKKLCMHFVQSKTRSIFFFCDELRLYSKDIQSALEKGKKGGHINYWKQTFINAMNSDYPRRPLYGEYTFIEILDHDKIWGHDPAWMTPSMSWWTKGCVAFWEKMRACETIESAETDSYEYNNVPKERKGPYPFELSLPLTPKDEEDTYDNVSIIEAFDRDEICDPDLLEHWDDEYAKYRQDVLNVLNR